MNSLTTDYRLINRAKFKRKMLELGRVHRSYAGYTRVSDQTYQDAERYLAQWMDATVRRSPSLGKVL